MQRSETLDILLATVIDHWIRRAVPPGSNPDQVYRTLLRDERARRALAQVRAVRNGSQAAAP